MVTDDGGRWGCGVASDVCSFVRSMIKEIEDIFNRGIFVQCITCGSTLCIVGYRILIVNPRWIPICAITM